MDTINHTDLRRNNSKIIRVLILALGFFLFTQKTFALNITILDTGFCPEKIVKNPNVTILSPVDLTDSVSIDCKSANLDRDKRFHGQKVLQTFLKNLSPKVSVNIRPFIIFDANKSQSYLYWKKAFSPEIQKVTDIYLVAAGLPYLGEFKKTGLSDLEIKKLVFVASGTQTFPISKDHKLWPQELAKTKGSSQKVYIVADYYPKTKYDEAYIDKRLMYKEYADFFFPYRDEADIHFHGSSYAVALGLAEILNKCDTTKLEEELSTKKCGRTILLDKNLHF